MRHIYNGGGAETGDSFDKDEAWTNCMELEMDQSGLGPRPLRWVDQTLPDTMCVVPYRPHHPCLPAWRLTSHAKLMLVKPFASLMGWICKN